MKFIKLKSGFDKRDIVINIQEITYCEIDYLNSNNVTIWFKNGKGINVKSSMEEVFNLIKMED